VRVRKSNQDIKIEQKGSGMFALSSIDRYILEADIKTVISHLYIDIELKTHPTRTELSAFTAAKKEEFYSCIERIIKYKRSYSVDVEFFRFWKKSRHVRSADKMNA
jgi:hypothetical protein